MEGEEGKKVKIEEGRKKRKKGRCDMYRIDGERINMICHHLSGLDKDRIR